MVRSGERDCGPVPETESVALGEGEPRALADTLMDDDGELVTDALPLAERAVEPDAAAVLDIEEVTDAERESGADGLSEAVAEVDAVAVGGTVGRPALVAFGVDELLAVTRAVAECEPDVDAHVVAFAVMETLADAAGLREGDAELDAEPLTERERIGDPDDDELAVPDADAGGDALALAHFVAPCVLVTATLALAQRVALGVAVAAAVTGAAADESGEDESVDETDQL